MYIIIAILIFGILIAVHELGHFLAAKSVGVKVNEFSIGMGPGIFKKQGKETLYSLRLLPIGGYCAIEGENDDSDDERSMGNKPLLARLFILFSGSFMNFLAGFLIVLIIVSFSPYYSTTRLVGFMDGFPLQGETGLMEGDRIVSIDGHSVNLLGEFSLYMDRRSNSETVDMVVIRDGKRVKLDDFPLVLREYEENGAKTIKYGILFGVSERTGFRHYHRTRRTFPDVRRCGRGGSHRRGWRKLCHNHRRTYKCILSRRVHCGEPFRYEPAAHSRS